MRIVDYESVITLALKRSVETGLTEIARLYPKLTGEVLFEIL